MFISNGVVFPPAPIFLNRTRPFYANPQPLKEICLLENALEDILTEVLQKYFNIQNSGENVCAQPLLHHHSEGEFPSHVQVLSDFSGEYTYSCTPTETYSSQGFRNLRYEMPSETYGGHVDAKAHGQRKPIYSTSSTRVTKNLSSSLKKIEMPSSGSRNNSNSRDFASPDHYQYISEEDQRGRQFCSPSLTNCAGSYLNILSELDQYEMPCTDSRNNSKSCDLKSPDHYQRISEDDRDPFCSLSTISCDGSYLSILSEQNQYGMPCTDSRINSKTCDFTSPDPYQRISEEEREPFCSPSSMSCNGSYLSILSQQNQYEIPCRDSRDNSKTCDFTSPDHYQPITEEEQSNHEQFASCSSISIADICSQLSLNDVHGSLPAHKKKLFLQFLDKFLAENDDWDDSDPSRDDSSGHR